MTSLTANPQRKGWSQTSKTPLNTEYNRDSVDREFKLPLGPIEFKTQ